MAQLWVGTRKGLFKLAQQGAGWQVVGTAFLGEPVVQTHVDGPSGHCFASLRLGHFGPKLHRSTDGGITWAEVSTPALPPKPSEGPFKDDPTPWSVEMLWGFASTPLAGGGHRLWASTMPAAVFYSDDAGQTWALCESFWHDERRLHWMGGGNDHPAAHTLIANPANPAHLTVAISCGGIWATRDSGKTWQLAGRGFNAEFLPPEVATEPNAQDPHRVSACAAEPSVQWCQLHGGVYRSTDFGENWQRLAKIEGVGDFGFAVAACPVNPKRAWLVPAVADTHRYAPGAALCVARTDDAGQTWQVFRQGLPQVHAYDLVYRHGLCVSADGQTLAMGSTTGNLWLSANAGESWQHQTAHLPPIASVAWVG
jgi:photosystem II stability/assembly factor-like uncharacterized protein